MNSCRTRQRWFIAIACWLLLAATPLGRAWCADSQTNSPDRLGQSKKSVQKIDVFPQSITLTSERDRQSIVALATMADGSTRDVTPEVSIASGLAKTELTSIVEYENETFLPLANGSTEVRLSFAGHQTTLPVTVSRNAEATRVGFRNDILPILTKAGCNTGKCHGAASGKDGFRLSLFGYDPAGDHFRLTREIHGRRVNLADPEHCLLVNKALGKVPHTGGGRLVEDEEDYALLLAWLRDGAQADPPSAPLPVSIEVFPKELVFSSPGQSQKLLVMAGYSDGTDRDVTAQTVFISNNEGTASSTPEGLLSANGPGSAFVMARFDAFTEGTSVVVRPGGFFAFPNVPEHNYIDRLVYDRLRNLNVIPSEVVDDDAFLRRVSLDMLGLLPTPAQSRHFRSSSNTNKRQATIADFANRPEFRDQWIMHWAELLQIRSNNGLSPKALALYDQWLRNRVHADNTIDQIVRELLSASGGTFDNPATNYFQTETSPQLIAESVAQVFLGTRIQCAQCHNHPFDRWTMDDYYGFASFFSQVGYKQSDDPRELTIFNTGEGEIIHPIAGRKVEPRFLDGIKPTIENGRDYRNVLANWVAQDNNMSFARNIANVVWAHFMGVGIVDPIDDFRVSNPPSNPALLEALARHLLEYKFDIRKLACDICSSRTYQLSVATNSTNALDSRNFSHGRVRRLRAEVLLDSIVQVTEAKERLPGLGPEGRAVQLADGPTPNYFLTTFGRSTRQTPCSCEVKTNPTLSQAMHLLNGETTNEKIKLGRVIERMLQDNLDSDAIAVELFERCYGRTPTIQERKEIALRLTQYAEKVEGLEDLFWALLNSNEFIFNH